MDHVVVLVDGGLHDLISQNLSHPYSRHYCVPFRKQRLSLKEMKY